MEDDMDENNKDRLIRWEDGITTVRCVIEYINEINDVTDEEALAMFKTMYDAKEI
jgi:hypothetical protein